MARTLVQIAADALGELGLPALSAISGSSAGDAVQGLALLNREGRELADLDGGWPILRGEQIITLVPDQEAYPFPDDIAYYRHNTIWDRTTHWRVFGPLSDREWQTLRSGTNVAAPWLRYRIFGGMIQFDPVPTQADTIVFEYISVNWAAAVDGTPKPAFTADTDYPLLAPDLFVLGLKWRLLAARGMNYAEERAAYDDAVSRKRPREEVPAILQLNQRGPRYGGFGSGLVPIGNWPGR